MLHSIAKVSQKTNSDSSVKDTDSASLRGAIHNCTHFLNIPHSENSVLLTQYKKGKVIRDEIGELSKALPVLVVS